MRVPPKVQAVVDRVLAWPPVVTARAVMDRFAAAGGGLLAGGLTYSALFALPPSLLLVTGILGLLVDDPERRRAIVEGIGQSVPPLEGLIEASLTEITRNAAGFGVLGLLGLGWGASRFYGSLDDAFARIFVNAPKRGIVARTLRGFVTVVLLVAAFVVALALTGLASFLAAQTEGHFGPLSFEFWRLASPALTACVFVVVVGLIYRLVPARRVTLRSLWLPALVVGIGLALLTQLFSYIAPRLIGSAAVFGTFVAIFATMVWMSTAFQILLVGAAWVRERLGPPPPQFLEDA